MSVFSWDTFCERSVVAVISFCDSSSSRTEVEYCPFELGVAGRKPDVESCGVPFVEEYGFKYGEDEGRPAASGCEE